VGGPLRAGNRQGVHDRDQRNNNASDDDDYSTCETAAPTNGRRLVGIVRSPQSLTVSELRSAWSAAGHLARTALKMAISGFARHLECIDNHGA
jgi:hypothetical protein